MESTTAYEAPSLTVVGSVEELTAGNKTGAKADRNIPINTPVAQFTLS